MRESLMCPSLGVPDLDDGVTQLQDDVLALLEAADLPTAVNDRIIAIIAEAERSMAGEP